MQLNFVAIIVATVLQFIVGAIWYSFLFGKLWGKIHGFDKLSKAVQQKMMSEMGPFYGLQFLVTLLSSVVLAMFVKRYDNYFAVAFLLWLGFIVPAQVSSVIFGGTDKKWIAKKILVQSGAAFICVEVAAAVLHFI